MRERKLLQGCLRKGSGIMEELASELLKELNCDTAFRSSFRQVFH